MTEPRTIEDTVRQAVRRWREEERHLTAQELSDAVAVVGGKLTRQAISQIETGKRSVSLSELFWLALALECPPLLLLLPVSRQTEIEIAPGRTAPVWETAQWFAGESAIPPLAGSGLEESPDASMWEASAAPLGLYRSFYAQLGSYRQYLDEESRYLEEAHAVEPGPNREVAEKNAASSTRSAEKAGSVLLTYVRQMRQSGVTPPQLSPDLTQLALKLQLELGATLKKLSLIIADADRANPEEPPQ